MRILSISAQKPDSTGSGVYLTEVVKALAEEGHRQAVVCGVYEEDHIVLPEGTLCYPVYFNSGKVPFPICGMSDEMPYPSTRYCDMTEDMTKAYRQALTEAVNRAVEELNPDLILCHHLYLLTSIVRREFPDRKIIGFCHNTDLRQMEKNPLWRDEIREQIRKLDRICVPQNPQADRVCGIYGVDPEKICTVGMGYNDRIFRRTGKRDTLIPGEMLGDPAGVTRIVFAGKIAEKKGVMSLIRCLPETGLAPDRIVLDLAGGAGNQEEYQAIRDLAAASPYNIRFPGKMAQPDLAALYNEAQIFVLPSFFDGIPLVVIEALACGDRVVVTELPGIRAWMEENAPGADIRYVKLPSMRNADELVPEELPGFEKRLAEALREAAAAGETRITDVSAITWRGLVRRALDGMTPENQPSGAAPENQSSRDQA